jgi:molybdate transport system ATP-binding protein
MLEIRVTHRFPQEAGGFSLDVDFSAEERCVCFFGHSGSGKTLTMQAVAGLFTPGAGRIAIGGRVVFDSGSGLCLPARKRRMGYLFQDYALFPHLTVRQNIAFGLEGGLRFTAGAGGNRRRVEEMLHSFEIAHLAEQFPARISGGQKQRVALARALATRPDLLLLDEPFSALDPLMRERVRRQCKDLLARFSTPALMITHDPADVAVFAESVALFENGGARMCVSAAELARQRDSDNELVRCLAAAVGEHAAGTGKTADGEG